MSATTSQTKLAGAAPAGPLPAATFILVADGTAPPIGFLNRATAAQVAELLAPLVGVILAGNSTPAAATAFTTALSASSGTVGNAVTLTATPTGTAWPSSVVLTPSATGLSGTFAPTTRTPSGTAATTFTFTPSAAGSGTIGVAANPSMTTPAGLAYQATAAATPTPAPAPAPAPTPTPTPAAAAQPTGVTLSNAAETSMTLAWTAPSNGPTPTAYDYAFSIDGGATFGPTTRTSGNPMPSSTLLSRLTPSTNYVARVTGVTGDINTGTLGAPSANSNTLSTTATTSPPNTPTSFSTTQSGANPTTNITLTWAGAVPPYVASATLTQRTPSGSGNFVPSTYTYNGSPYMTARGLTPGSSYDFQLVLTNSIGSTPAVTLTNVSTASA